MIYKNSRKFQEKGITLITLVITIVILIILSTVSIGVLGGENGIIKKSKYAKEQTEIAQELDILKISTALAMGEDAQGNVTEVNLRNELDKNIKNYSIESKGDKFKVVFESGRSYIVDITGNVSEYYDGWEDIEVANPKVVFNYNGATTGNSEKEKQLTYGSTYGSLPTPSKTVTVSYDYKGATGGNGTTIDTTTYTFGGWYKESSFKNLVTENTQVTTTNNHMLYAKWTGGGITLPTPTKEGYTFQCWCTDETLKNSVGTGGSIYNATSNITLFAKWTQNPIITFTITYNKNTTDTVENMPTSQTKIQGTNLKLSDLVPTRAGYTFQGWSTNMSQTGTGEYQAGATYTQDDNLILYAVWKKAGTPSIEIAKDATNSYGKIVEGYNERYERTGNNEWVIFMADDSNIYLTPANYINYTYVPDKNGSHIDSLNTSYELSFRLLLSSYSGAKDIDNVLANKWLSIYWNFNNNSSSTADSMKAVAYILDTSIWNLNFKTRYNFVEYVIGSPTLEMYCKSYKDTHSNQYIECNSMDDNGYQVRWNGGSYNYSISGIPADEFNGIYLKSEKTEPDARGLFLASPTSYGRWFNEC